MTDMTPAEAMWRLNEIDRVHPRIQSRKPASLTVLESDQEWLARTKVDATEWHKLWRIAKGEAA
jgi:hypothetical protein